MRGIAAIADQLIKGGELIDAAAEFDIAPAKLRRMMVTGGMGKIEQFIPQRNDVLCAARGFQFDIEARLQPFTVRRHSGRAASSVTFPRLDTTDRHHRFARDIDHVAAQREGDHCAAGKAKFAAADPYYAFGYAGFLKNLIHASKPNFKRQRNMIGERQRCRAGPAFSAVDRNEIRALIALAHTLREHAPGIYFTDCPP